MKRTILVVLAFILANVTLSAQTKFGIGVNGTYFAPIGDFGDVYKSGFGGSASLLYNVNDNIQLSLSSGYAQFSFNNEKFNQLLSDFFSAFGTTVKVDINSKLNIIPVMLGGKYFFTNSAFKPYAALDLGLHIVSVDASSFKVNSQSYDAVKGQSKAATAWGIGIGFMYQVAPKINLDVNGKINGNNLEVGTSFSGSTGTSSASQSSNSTVTFLSVGAGLVFEL
ncbi:MAG: porin family protein [Bacteroidetes bacterium]|nr:porin family protein [Bacteroidota bacterium]